MSFSAKLMENDVSCTISTMRVSVSLGYPNNKKQLKAQAHRPRVFIVSRLGFYKVPVR